MYEIIKTVIELGRYELPDILKKIDTVWMQGDITDQEKEELITLSREKADFSSEIDMIKKLEELEIRVKKLESGQLPPENQEEYPVYIQGKWYYKDDKITYKSEKYICIAPDGQVCTWNPEEYPTYWKKV